MKNCYISKNMCRPSNKTQICLFAVYFYLSTKNDQNIQYQTWGMYYLLVSLQFVYKIYRASLAIPPSLLAAILYNRRASTDRAGSAVLGFFSKSSFTSAVFSFRPFQFLQGRRFYYPLVISAAPSASILVWTSLVFALICCTVCFHPSLNLSIGDLPAALASPA